MSTRTGGKKLWKKFRYVVAHSILHLDDTPHRIALGVFIGFFIGATPTMGVQTPLYFAVASMLRANVISGIVPVWFTNPLTAVPIYYGCWRFGGWLLTGRWEASPESQAAIARLIEGPDSQAAGFGERILDPDFWHAAIGLLRSIGLELWVGSIVFGAFVGALGYLVTYRGVVVYRQRVNRPKGNG